MVGGARRRGDSRRGRRLGGRRRFPGQGGGLSWRRRWLGRRGWRRFRGQAARRGMHEGDSPDVRLLHFARLDERPLVDEPGLRRAPGAHLGGLSGWEWRPARRHRLGWRPAAARSGGSQEDDGRRKKGDPGRAQHRTPPSWAGRVRQWLGAASAASALAARHHLPRMGRNLRRSTPVVYGRSVQASSPRPGALSIADGNIDLGPNRGTVSAASALRASRPGRVARGPVPRPGQ